jgi:peptide/nickel transport system substrate-binding protein/oligopeptide transport system substrate-binding protein
MNRTFWILILLATSCCVGLLLSAEWSGRFRPGVHAPLDGGEYQTALANDPPTLDPALATDSTSSWCVLQLFDGLVRFQGNNEGSVGPAIASTWTISPDQCTYTFHLRGDVRFHAVHHWLKPAGGRTAPPSRNKGRLVEAQDFVYSFERVLARETQSARTAIFEEIDGARDFMEGRANSVRGLAAPDARTVVIRLAKPYAPFLATLTMPNAFVVPREDVAHLGPEFARRPVGTGPFLLDGYEPGRALRLERNPAYFGGVPHLTRVTLHIQSDEEKRFQMFLGGDLHHSTVPDPYYNMIRERDGKWHPYLTEVSELGVYYYGMNVKRAPFDRREVRQALNFAVDRDAIRKYIKSDRVDAAMSPLPPSLRLWERDRSSHPPVHATPIHFNLAHANQLLAQAGYPADPVTGARPGFPVLPLHIPAADEHMRIARAVQANLADLGIRCRVVVNPWKEHLALLRKGEASFFRLGWVADYKDADNFLFYNFHSSRIGTSNYTDYSNPVVDDLLHRARQNTRAEYRNELYRLAEEIIVRDAPWICMFYFKTAIVRQPSVRGIDLTEFGEHMIRFHEVWLDRSRGTQGS